MTPIMSESKEPFAARRATQPENVQAGTVILRELPRRVEPSESPTIAAGRTEIAARGNEEDALFEKGTQFGDYELLCEVGRGGMGFVYKARHRSLNRIVALKVTRLAGNLIPADEAQRFQVEAAAAAKLDHPYIVPMYEAGEALGRQFFSMAFVEGASLDQAVARGPLPQYRAAELIHQVAEAIAYAHSQGVVHRDLKPENILLDVSGRPRITDFGIAKFMDSDSHLTQAGDVIGTPGYMPPEQARGRMDQAGPWSDVYSLGATLYCLLTSRPPFQSANALDTLRQVEQREPLSPREVNAAVSQDLETICLKCLEKRPERRYASAQALADDLRRFLDHRPILARPVSVLEKAVRWRRRNPVLAASSASIATVFLTAFLLVSWSYWAADEARREEAFQRQKADAAAEDAIRHEHTERWERYRANLAAVSSAQASQFVATARKVLDSAPEEFRNWEWRHFQSQVDGSERVIQVYEGRNTPQAVFLGNDAVAAFDDQMRIWELGAGRPLESLPDRVSQLRGGFQFSPDCRRLAYPSSDSSLTIWDVAARKRLATIRGGKDWFGCTEFSPDGDRLYAYSRDRRLRIWDAETGRLLRTSSELTPTEPLGASLSNYYCLLNYSDDSACLFDIESGRKLHVLRGPMKNLVQVVFDQQGTRVLTSEPFPQNVMRLWDAKTGKEIAVLKGHRNEAHPVLFSPDGTRIASCSFDQTARLWNGTTGAPIATLHGHNGRIRTASFSPDSKRLLTGSDDRTLRLWDAETGEALAVLVGHSAEVFHVAYSPDGAHIASGSLDGSIRIWNSQRVEANGVLRGHTSYVYGAAFHPDGRRVVSASWDGTVRVWDATTAREMAQFRTAKPSIFTAVAIHPAGRIVATRGRDDTVRLWDLTTGKQIHQWNIPTDYFLDGRLAFSRKGDLLACGSREGAVHVWRMENRSLAAVLQGAPGVIHDVAFSADGRWLASAGYSGEGTIRIWDLETKTLLHVLQGHRLVVLSLAVSDDGKLLASGSEDGTVRLWDTQSWSESGLIKHGMTVYGLAFTPDGTRLAAACADSVIRLSDVASRQDVAELRGHRDYVYSLSFSPDGTRFVSGSGDFTLRIWDTVPVAERERPPNARSP